MPTVPRLRLGVLLLAAAAALLPAARATAECGNAGIVVFSRAGTWVGAGVAVGGPSVDAKDAGCIAGADTRMIWPGSSMVRVRYYPCDANSVALPARIAGLGVDATVSLEPAPLTPGTGAGTNVYCEGGWVPIDPLARGQLHVWVYRPGATDADVYHTL